MHLLLWNGHTPLQLVIVEPATGIAFVLGEEIDQLRICHISKIHHRFLAALAMPTLLVGLHAIPVFMAAFLHFYLDMFCHLLNNQLMEDTVYF